jgi:hypothetical protein
MVVAANHSDASDGFTRASCGAWPDKLVVALLSETKQPKQVEDGVSHRDGMYTAEGDGKCNFSDGDDTLG